MVVSINGKPKPMLLLGKLMVAGAVKAYELHIQFNVDGKCHFRSNTIDLIKIPQTAHSGKALL